MYPSHIFSQSLYQQHKKQRPDPELLQLLTKWGVEILYPTCLDQEINLEILRYMTSRHCELLTKNFHLSVLVKFEHHLRRWQIEQKTQCVSYFSEIAGERETNSQMNEMVSKAQNILPIVTHIETSAFNVKSVLEKSTQGRTIIDKYKNSLLSDHGRTILVDLIINNLIENDIKMSTTLAEDIAEQIVVIFPAETKELYFLRERGRAILGKLYCKYFNLIRCLKNSGLIPKRPVRASSTSSEDQDEEVMPLDINNKTCSDDCDWTEIENHWRSTTKHRLAFIKRTPNIEHIFSEYKQYKSPLGYKLIDIDFNEAFPNTPNFTNEFSKYLQRLIHLFKEKIKDPASVILLSELKEINNLSENGRYAVVLYLLHAVLVPTGREMSYRKNDNKKIFKKFSIKDSQNSFLIIGNTIQEIEKNLLHKKQDIPPVVILTGTIDNPKDIVVYFETIKYKLSSVLQAIDICFKMFILFNVKYPSASILVWQFLQKFFYGINLKHDRNSPYLTFLINQMKKNE